MCSLVPLFLRISPRRRNWEQRTTRSSPFLGATDYKVKPVQLNDLVRLLHKLHDRYLSAPSEH
ncbi:hypothetical protein SBV1_2450002 [Verrucomicrobia bacterium]|nr:hypothetical protein SBV1_2450002 [Verrucomicrobiota bacterium]